MFCWVYAQQQLRSLFIYLHPNIRKIVVGHIIKHIDFDVPKTINDNYNDRQPGLTAVADYCNTTYY